MRKQVEESVATGAAVGVGFRPGESARRCCVCCAGRISSRCRGHWESRRRSPGNASTSLLVEGTFHTKVASA